MSESQISLNERVELFSKPTPLELSDGLLSEDLNLWIKRDDLTSIGAGGNKARKLEYFVYDAIKESADTLVTTGSLQSNHARMTAAAAAKYDFSCHLILMTDDGKQPTSIEGNRLLEEILDVDITYTTPAEASKDIDQVMKNISSEKKSPYFIQGGGHTPKGAIGYVDCINELDNQIGEVDYIVTAIGTGTTQAGLIAGVIQKQWDTKVHGISVARSAHRCKQEIKEILNDLNRNKVIDKFEESDIVVYDDYIGSDGYGTVTQQAIDAVQLVAQSEGIFLEPTYTGKAFGGMIDLLNTKKIEPNSNIIFIHSGGFPGLFVSKHKKDNIWQK